MALLKPSDLSPDEQRAADLEGAFSGTRAAIVGFKPVRRVTALVVEILRKANNFFITGARGFKDMGIDPKKFQSIVTPKIDGKDNPDFDPSKAGAMVPKIAEVIALLTCSEDDMDSCDDDIAHLAKIRRKVMKSKTMNEIMETMGDVQAEFVKINRSTAVVDDDAESSSVDEAKKKRGPASSPATS